VRRVLEAIGLKVNRLIRVSYGPFELGDLEAGAAHEISTKQVKRVLEGELAPPPPGPHFVRSRTSKKDENSKGKRLVPPKVRPTGARPAKAGKTTKAEPAAKIAYKPGWARPKRKPTPKATPKSGAGRRRPKS